MTPPRVQRPIITKVLGSVVCTPAKAAVGEAVRVEVRRPDGVPYDNKESASISINGTPGSALWVTWRRPGTKKILVQAHGRRGIEKLEATIEIAERRDEKDPPELRVEWSVEQPGRAFFSVVNLPRVPSKPPGRPVARKPAGRGKRIVRGGDDTPTTFTWDFGEGPVMSTTKPSTYRDFLTRLDPARAHGVFHIAVTVQRPGQRPLVLRRSIVLHNPYHLAKRRGVLQPPVVSQDLSARFKRGVYRARFTVFNPESVDMKLTGRRFERYYESGPRDAEMLALQPIDLVLRAQRETTIDVVVPRNILPDQIDSFAAHYIGQGPGGRAVRVVAHFDLPEHVHMRRAVPPALLAKLTEAIRRGQVSDPRLIRGDELRRIAGQVAPARKITKRQLPAPPPTPEMHVLDHKTPNAAVEGKECDPWNLPDVVPTGMFCMPTTETKTVLMPPRFMNARKGDLVLSPGDGGLIAMTLAAVSPPQPFSHSGIMTRNRDEITHSTASESRMTDSEYAGTDGIRPDVLKYLWPGVITQTVEQAVHGEKFVDPETGTAYTIAGFKTMIGTTSPPMVVKPDPFLETSAIRKKLHEVADFAWQQEGKSHYRFFCYTDPGIGLTDVAPDEAKWAAGTFPSVCSSLIWMAMRNAGIAMEGALEQKDMDAGAHIADGTPDGLYVYDAAERLAAGEVLYSGLMGMLWDNISDVVDLFSDAREDIANQILNTFATDWADEDAKDSEAWRETVDANAVSPMNLMFYDTPHYGFAEQLIFRDARVEEVVVHKWKLVEQTGTITGAVRHDGKAVEGAEVQVTAANVTHSGKNDGRFELKDVPAGEVIVEAQKLDGDILLLGKKKVTVKAGQTTDITVNLEAPSHLFRRIEIEGSLAVTDYEFAAAAYPHSVGHFDGFADLDPNTATHVVRIFDHVTDDAYGRVILTFDLNTDDSVDVRAEIRCYDSDKPDTDDYHHWSTGPHKIKAGHTIELGMYTDDDNYARADLTLRNRTNQS